MESTFVHVACQAQPFTISPALLRGIKVKRDMEVVRKVLRAVQDKNDLDPKILKVEGVDDFTAGHHIAMLHAAGYIEGPSTLNNSVPYRQVLVKDLTWEGHEFVASLYADESTWEKVKAALGPEKLAGLSLKTIQEILTKAVTAWAMQKIGL